MNGAAADSDLPPEMERFMSPTEAAKVFSDKLTFFEKKEIESYQKVYYAGEKCDNKVKAPTSGPNDGYDTADGEYVITKHDHIAYRYEIVDHLGSGAFGQVVRAYDHRMGFYVAVKLIRNKKKVAHQAKTEVEILRRIKEKDPFDKYNVVQMLDSFTFRSHICLVYELLGTNLYDHMEQTDFFPMSLGSVRKVAARMLVALTFLWKEKIIHCDLKPENILYKTDASSDVIKVADLGSACYDSNCAYTYIQSRFYRAPEVILGLPFGRPIDMWSFGCILCELATGYPLFPGENEMDQLACIMEFLGPPPESMITASKKRRAFFEEDLTPKMATNSKGRVRTLSSRTVASFLGLGADDLFVSFLEQFMCWDPEKRVPPRQAMRHPWIEEEFVFHVVKAAVQGDAAADAAGNDASAANAAATSTAVPQDSLGGREATHDSTRAATHGNASKESRDEENSSRRDVGNKPQTISARATVASDAVGNNAADLTSPKRNRQASLLFQFRSSGVGNGGAAGDDIVTEVSSSARSMIAADHQAANASVPPDMRRANASAPLSQSVTPGNHDPVATAPLRSKPANNLVRAQTLSTRAVPDKQLPTLAGGQLARRASQPTNTAAYQPMDSVPRPVNAPGTTVPAASSRGRPIEVGKVASLADRFGGTVANRGGAPSPPSSDVSLSTFTSPRGQRAKTATFGANSTGTCNGGEADMRRRASEAFPRINCEETQLPSPLCRSTVAATHANGVSNSPNERTRGVSEGARDRRSSCSSSRRQEFAQRRPRRSYQMNVEVVPEPGGSSVQPRLPPIGSAPNTAH